MKQKSLQPNRITDPYALLALHIIKYAFKEIESYYNYTGSAEEMKGGKDAVNWIINMKGTFKTVSLATDLPLEKFHQYCLEKINIIKSQAHENRTRGTN